MYICKVRKYLLAMYFKLYVNWNLKNCYEFKIAKNFDKSFENYFKFLPKFFNIQKFLNLSILVKLFYLNIVELKVFDI